VPGATLTWLELTDASQLVQAQPRPEIELREIGPQEASLVGETYVRIWNPIGGGGRTGWSETDWRSELSRPGVGGWIAEIGGLPAGLLELDAGQRGEVGIVIFGLVPEFAGHGFGGAFLTAATEIAWALPSVRRVVVCTSSRDHPAAQPNYERRGFRVFREEVVS
jgi:GNAT superfamily N-acetyltransferase